MASRALLDTRVGELLEQLADESPTPGGGLAAACALGMAAAVCTMAARASVSGWNGALGAAAQAGALRDRALKAAQANVRAHERALAALDEPGELRPEQRDWALGTALDRAAELPLEIGRIAADVAELAALIAREGAEATRPDATSAAFIAEAGARAAAALVAANLTVVEGDERLAAAGRSIAAAADAAARAAAT